MKKKKFNIEGMDCASCQAHLDHEIRKINGISYCNVSLLKNTLEVEYDERGNFVKVTFLGIDGFSVINTDGGCACIQFKYDENDNKIEANYYDSLGQPCLILNGYAQDVHTHYNTFSTFYF